MNTSLPLGLLLAGGLLLLSSCEKDEISMTDKISENPSNSIQESSSEERYIILLDDDTGKSASDNASPVVKTQRARAAATALLVDHEIATSIDALYSEALPGFSAKMTTKEAAALHADPRVKMIEKDQAVSLADHEEVSIFGEAGNENSAYGQLETAGISNVGYADGRGKTIWVLDSGVDMDHPDLNVDSQRSVSYLYGSGANLSPDDQHGHGTHVAGIIAAKDNDFGVVGVAAGANIVSVRVLDQNGDGHTSRIISAVDHVARYGRPGDVANLSFGGGASPMLDIFVRVAGLRGIQMVLAAGNHGIDSRDVSPARAQGVNVYTISAVDNNFRFAEFSNYGSGVDFAAPGVRVISTYHRGRYAVMSGTSMAAPHVAGLLAIGPVTIAGFATGDPDGKADPILRLY